MAIDDASLGDQNTFAGAKHDTGPQSLGDEQTFSDIGLADDGASDDGMEIVDLTSRYAIGDTLGKGGMGEVLLATDKRLKRQVAIKRVRGDLAKSKTAVGRFLTEAQSIAALNHFNIVQIYDYGQDKDGPFLIMEYVSGSSLLDRCQEGALPLDEAVELTCQLCDGLSKAHEAGIIHRDIKPANVLLTEDGAPKLTDFGLARQDTSDTGQTMAGAVLGTLDFMPPEQRKDSTLTDARSDLWALAATLYQLVTGKSPKVIRLNAVPEVLQDVLGKALEEAPPDRYQNASEFRSALRQAMKNAPSQSPAELSTGECRSCGLRNDEHRKFCQGCGTSLVEPCLKCLHEIGVWEEFCGECGASQKDLSVSRTEELDQQRESVGSLRREYRYEEALQILKSLSDESHPRFSTYPVWANEVRPEVEREYAETRAERERLTGEARVLLSQNRYREVPRLFEELSKGLWNSEVKGLLQQAERSVRESEELLAEIKLAIRERKFDGLVQKTGRFLELRPDRSDIAKVHARLKDREEKLTAKMETRARERAAELLDEVRERLHQKDFVSVVLLLEDMPEGYETEESMDLLRKAQIRVERAEQLLSQIEKAVKLGQTAELLPKLDEYLKLVSSDERIESLRQKLASEQKTKRRKLVGIAGAAAAVLVVLTVGYSLWSNSQERSRAIADGLTRQAWDEVLELDGSNATALVGRANQRLSTDPPTIEEAFADLEQAESADSSVAGLQDAMALAYVSRALAKALADQVIEAQADLREARTLGAPDTKLSSAKQALAAAYLKVADTQVKARQVADALKSRDQAATLGAAEGDLASINDQVADAYLNQATTLAVSGDTSAALNFLKAARELNPDQPRLSQVEAMVHVQLAQTAIKAGISDTASAEFLVARTLDPQAAGLGALAAGLADGLVQRCEDQFTDAAFAEATAALQTVAELEPDSESLPGLKDRLGKVLVSQGDAALADGSLPRVGAIIESLKTLNVLPDDQTSLADGLFTSASAALTSALEKKDLPSVAQAVKLVSGLAAVEQAKRAQLIADATTPFSEMLLEGLKGDQPQEAATILTDLVAAMPELANAMQEDVSGLPDEVKALLPGSLRRIAPPSWLTDGLVAYYPFNGDAKDESGNANDGKSQSARLVTGPRGKPQTAYSFTNAEPDAVKRILIGTRSNPVVVPSRGYLNLTSPSGFTINFWAKRDGACDFTFILSKAEGGGPAKKWIVTLGEYKHVPQFPGAPFLGFHWPSGRRGQWALSDPFTWDTEWHSYSISKTDDTFAFYKDGISIGSTTNSQPLIDNSGPLRIGKSPESEPAFDGSVSDVRIYDHGLSAEEVKALYEYESQPPSATTAGNQLDDWGLNYLVIDSHAAAFQANATKLRDVVIHNLNDGAIAKYPMRTHANEWETYEVRNAVGKLTPIPPAAHKSGYAVLNKGSGPETVMMLLREKLPLDFELSFDLRHEGPGHSHIKLLRSPYPATGVSISTPPGERGKEVLGFYTKIEGSRAAWAHTPLHGDVSIETGPFPVQTGNEWLSYRIRKSGSSLTMWINDKQVAHTDKLRTFPRQAPPPAVAPFDAAQAKAHQKAWAGHLGVPVETTNSIGMKFVVIPPGEFMMGSPEDEPGRQADETLHKVTLTQPFMMGMYEVTQEQYESVMGTNPSKFKGSQNPIERVSWDDASEFCRKLSALPAEKSSGYVYRLPTEAAWEYACRAGTTTKSCFGDSESALGDYAWYDGNSGGTTHTVGGKKPNPWGLYDVYGNVWEWCHDWYDPQYQRKSPLISPHGPESGTERVYRGGSYHPGESIFCVSGKREGVVPEYRGANGGFRIAVEVRYEFPSKPSATTGQVPPPAVAPFNANQAKAQQKAWADYLGVPVERSVANGMLFRLIPPGEFMMGAPENDSIASDTEKPQHRVRISKPFYIAKHVVTQKQYQQVTGSNPSATKSDDRPVTTVSWDDASAFCEKLSGGENVGGRYRLPTSAEWEYACRAGTITRYFFGETESEVDQYISSTTGAQADSPTLPNPWDVHYEIAGLRDSDKATLPGIWEWPLDGRRLYAETSEVLVDPRGPLDRSARGTRRLRSSFRGANLPQHGGRIGPASDLSFRVVLEISDEVISAAEKRVSLKTAPSEIKR